MPRASWSKLITALSKRCEALEVDCSILNYTRADLAKITSHLVLIFNDDVFLSQILASTCAYFRWNFETNTYIYNNNPKICLILPLDHCGAVFSDFKEPDLCLPEQKTNNHSNHILMDCKYICNLQCAPSITQHWKDKNPQSKMLTSCSALTQRKIAVMERGFDESTDSIVQWEIWMNRNLGLSLFPLHNMSLRAV